MNTLLWILQGWLAATFVASGLAKMILPPAKLHGSTRDLPVPFIRFLGTAEVLGAAGVVLPWALGVLPILTPLAAAGLAAIMLGAIRAHVRRREWGFVVGTVTLFAAAAVVAIERSPLV
jgi:DoxX-like family